MKTSPELEDISCSSHSIPGICTILKIVRPPTEVMLSVLAKTSWIILLLMRGREKIAAGARIPTKNREQWASAFRRFLGVLDDSLVSSLPIEKRYSGVR
jgi:hypothetical protein